MSLSYVGVIFNLFHGIRRKFFFQRISFPQHNSIPLVLYTCVNGNTPLAMPISKDPSITTTSNVFRLEKLDGCCATCRVLAPNTDESSVFPYEATNSFFTINLGCCCVLRCLDDTFVDGI